MNPLIPDQSTARHDFVGAHLATVGNNSTCVTQFLAFKLGREEYGIDILRVQEIRSFEAPTRMANAPAYVSGVVNLRGEIVPIIDMRIKFNLQEVRFDSFTVVIVLNIGKQVIGMVVDGVSDVITLTPEQMRPVPDLSSSITGDHLLAIGSLEDRMLILLDIEKFLAPVLTSETPTLAH